MKRSYLASIVALLLVSSSVWAISTSFFENKTEQDFKKGVADNIVINNRGQMSLARQTHTLLPRSSQAWVINSIITAPDGTVYAATSGRGYIYKIVKGEKPQIIYGKNRKTQGYVFSLGFDAQGRLLAGTGGKAGLLLRFSRSGKVKTIFSAADVKYIWAIATGPAGRIYLGTGPDGKVITLGSDGKGARVLYKAKEKNILAVALNKNGILYAGGDKYGLVYRIDPATKETTIAYDTGHKEISALVFDDTGNLYISTADAGAAKPGAKLILSNGDTSHPADRAGKVSSQEKKEQKKEGAKQQGHKTTGIVKKLSPAAVKSSAKRSVSRPVMSRPAHSNDVYQLSPAGYVHKIFSKPVVILAMKYVGNNRLLLATGNEGKLLQLNVATEESVVLYSAKGSIEISAVGVDSTGSSVYVGAANPASLVVLESTYERKGVFTSVALDARQVSKWGRVQVAADIPAGVKLLLSTRSGNTADPERGGWQGWTRPVEVRDYVKVASLPGWFLQYRLEMLTADIKRTATVSKVRIAYVTPNLPPQIDLLKVVPPTKPGSTSRKLSVTWKAVDANNDKLLYSVYVRPVDTEQWVQVAKDITVDKYSWDGLSIADGRYEIKVSVSDRLSNPAGQALQASRVSSPVVIDNTPPEILELGYDIIGNNKVRVHTRLRDAMSIIGSVEYTVDSNNKWNVAVPIDGIFDSNSEQVNFTFKVKSKGEHFLAVRFADALGNTVYRNLMITVP